MKLTQKKFLLILLISVILVILIMILSLSDKKKSSEKQAAISPTEELIPTVDSSVKVELIAQESNQGVLLKVANLPQGTESIDYELSYQTKSQGLQGVIGTIDVLNNNRFEKKILLGTCSSGTCVYHQVVGKIKLNLKFNGVYGEKIFEKEFEL